MLNHMDKSGILDRWSESVNVYENIIDRLLEAEEPEDFDLKDITEPDEVIGGPTQVKRIGRMKLVDTPRYTFLISYLTPVAYLDKYFGKYYKSTKHWSPTTSRHISDWQRMIWQSPEYKNDPANREPREPSEWYPEGYFIAWPRFINVRQARISGLFRKLMPAMEMKRHLKRRLYHVPPGMRWGADAGAQWVSGHLKLHDTGKEGLPMPDEPGFGEFFKDFSPLDPEYYEWDSGGRRSTEPYERDKPDEE